MPPGVVEKVDIQFPTGCVGLVHTLCRRGGVQVYPTNRSANYHTSGQTITTPDDYLIDDAPFIFQLVAWNEDDTFEHVITWRFSVRGFAQDLRADIAIERFMEQVGSLEVEF